MGTFKIADFGCARLVGSYNVNLLTKEVGSPAYSSPELLNYQINQNKQQHYTTKTDIWSFLFYILNNL